MSTSPASAATPGPIPPPAAPPFPAQEKEASAEDYSKFCPAIMGIAIIVISALAYAGVMPPLAFGATIISLGGVSALSRLTAFGTPLKGEADNNDDKKCARIGVVVQTVAELAIYILIGAIAIDYAAMPSIAVEMGRVCLVFVAIDTMRDCWNFGKNPKTIA